MSAPTALEQAPPVQRRRVTQRRTLVAVLLVLSLAVAARMWLVAPVLVASDSMAPTLEEGSLALVLKPDPGAHRVSAGTTVVFPHPEDGSTTIKRVIATGGQTVELRDALLFVDGQEVPEPFVDHSRIDGTWFGPAVVPPGHVFLMGDNRGASVDSRHFGTIPAEELEATVLWPWR
jgi:signal peptidase I